MSALLPLILADTWLTNFHDFGLVAQSFAAILTGLIAVLGVPLALRQIVNLQREQRLTEAERQKRLDAEANLNITADYSLSHASTADQLPTSSQAARQSVAQTVPSEGAPSQPPGPAPQPGKRVLRMDLTLENVGEGTVDILACLVAARELERQGAEVVAEGRDAQWDDLTRHYWNAADGGLSPGLSTTKHIVYAPDALARVKAKSRKTLARVDQVRDFRGEVYLLYRVFVGARRASRSVATLQDWTALQRALLNVNAPAFRGASAEADPLGQIATPDGWRLFLHHYAPLADAKLPLLRRQADRELRALPDPAAYAQASVRLDAELQEYCRRELLPTWRAYRADLARISDDPRGFQALLANKRFRTDQREVEKRFPWQDQEVWVEYFYVTLEAE
jgi:hypothetical protein